MFAQYETDGFVGIEKHTRHCKIWDMDDLIIPVNTPNHWIAVVISNPRSLITTEEPINQYVCNRFILSINDG